MSNIFIKEKSFQESIFTTQLRGYSNFTGEHYKLCALKNEDNIEECFFVVSPKDVIVRVNKIGEFFVIKIIDLGYS